MINLFKTADAGFKLFLLVIAEGVAERTLDHGAKLGRLEDGDSRAIAEELRHKIVGEAYIVCEKREFIGYRLGLRTVQRQRPEILGLTRIDPDHDLARIIVRDNNAV